MRPCAIVCVAFLFATLGACNTRVIDLGGHENAPLSFSDAAPKDSAVTLLPGSELGCSAGDQDILTARGETCLGSCGDVVNRPYLLSSPLTLVSAISGKWLYCEPPTFGPVDAVGIEFAPGCRIYFLVRDHSGDVVRGTEAAYQANINLTSQTDQVVFALLDGSSPRFTVSAYHCPNLLRLAADDGSIFTVASDGSWGDAGRNAPN